MPASWHVRPHHDVCRRRHPATGTNEVTAVIEHKETGRVRSVGSATHTHTLTADGRDAAFAAASQSGFSRTRYQPQDQEHRGTITTQPTTTVEVYNGAFSSKRASDSQAQYATLVPVTPDVVVINHSHNHSHRRGPADTLAVRG